MFPRPHECFGCRVELDSGEPVVLTVRIRRRRTIDNETWEEPLLLESPEYLPAARQLALGMLREVALQIDREPDTELVRLLAETRRRIVQAGVAEM